jgi:hypothetical protein
MTSESFRAHGLHLAVLAGLALSAGEADAHAYPKSSDPPGGAVLGRAPESVTIAFSEGLEPKFSAIKVVDAAGTEVDLGDSALAPGDSRHLVVHLKPLAPGAYKVEWHVTSVDAHKTEGSFGFTVAP